MTHQYRRLSIHKQNPEDRLLEDQQQQEQDSTNSFPRWLSTFVVLLFFTNAVTLLGSLYWTSWRELSIKAEVPLDYAELQEPIDSTVWRRFWWKNTNNTTGTDSTLWRDIHPSHGFIAMDHIWTAERNWPQSMNLPSDSSKGVYLLEAYHYLHCLHILRETLWEAVDQKPYTHPPDSRIEYCFDTLWQYIECNADSTPLYTFGGFIAGNGQLHRCKDWNQLRDFATRHTACVRGSVEFCDKAEDGVEDLENYFE